MVSALVVASCASADGTDRGALREAVVEPGITAVQEAPAAACSTDAGTIGAALDTYEVLEGQPAPDEQALIDGGYLRSPSANWDVANGELIPQNPDCGGAAPTLAPIEIVTETSIAGDEAPDPDPIPLPETPADLVAQLPPEEITRVGGEACALEVAVAVLGANRWAEEHALPPGSLELVATDGYIEPLTLWTVDGPGLVPTPDGGCVGPFDVLAQFAP